MPGRMGRPALLMYSSAHTLLETMEGGAQHMKSGIHSKNAKGLKLRLHRLKYKVLCTR